MQGPARCARLPHEIRERCDFAAWRMHANAFSMKSVQNPLELAEILNSRVALSHIDSRQNRDHAAHEQRWSGGVVHRTQNIWQMSLQDRRIIRPVSPSQIVERPAALVRVGIRCSFRVPIWESLFSSSK